MIRIMRRVLLLLPLLAAGCATAAPAAQPLPTTTTTTVGAVESQLDRYYAGARDLDALMACLEAHVCGPDG